MKPCHFGVEVEGRVGDGVEEKKERKKERLRIERRVSRGSNNAQPSQSTPSFLAPSCSAGETIEQSVGDTRPEKREWINRGPLRKSFEGGCASMAVYRGGITLSVLDVLRPVHLWCA